MHSKIGRSEHKKRQTEIQRQNGVLHRKPEQDLQRLSEQKKKHHIHSSSTLLKPDLISSNMLRPLLFLFAVSGLTGVNGNLCTVTGPTVIDVNGVLNSVSDRCEYTLLHDQNTGLTLKANFLERRRRDVSFVDSLTLVLSEFYELQLLQGQRVMVAGSPVTLNSSVQTFTGFDLSKDQTGVTAGFSVSGVSLSLFFDGTTAQIDMDFAINGAHSGLCVDSNSSSSSRLSSDTSCQEQHVDPVDDTINCPTVTQQCNILKSAPFSSCNSKVDPQPYIDACTETMCKYPDVDGLRCQFLEAYAKACENSQAPVQNWWTAAQCHNSQSMCEQQCKDHEFCGDIHGNNDCRCRAIDAHQYTDQNRLGGPTVCKDNTASLSLVGCLLKENGIDYTHLHLNDQTCKGVMDQDTHMVTFSFSSDSCGAVVTTNNSQVTFTNAIVTRNSSSDLITRQDKVFIEFSCSQPKPELQNLAFNILDNSVEIVLQSGEWKYSVTMKAYSDAAHSQLLSPKSDVRLNQKIWIVLETEGLDKDVVSVVTESCWATSGNSSSSTPRYDLIQNGCPNAEDGTVQVMGNEGQQLCAGLSCWRSDRSAETQISQIQTWSSSLDQHGLDSLDDFHGDLDQPSEW
ncbi:hypothetical protein OJAV_G00183990 [Oryzias javanicus]|uniref:ZP domain-containing protein n=1 Tax=Oryzias javanicus TaxID=123683 RepID=A0A3S2NW57_ORYJA|nr:hypothetical protein OJAV_G00183990 [Oryzias javanicus]